MNKIKSERGQSLVEMAISIVILLLLISGIVEFGMAFFQFIQLRDAAQEGALYGSINPTDVANITLRTKGASSSPINLTTDPNLTIAIQYKDNKKCEGDAITVRLTYQHKIFMPFVPTILGKTAIPLNASVTDTIISPLCP